MAVFTADTMNVMQQPVDYAVVNVFCVGVMGATHLCAVWYGVVIHVLLGMDANQHPSSLLEKYTFIY
jgi:hypothetical protein